MAISIYPTCSYDNFSTRNVKEFAANLWKWFKVVYHPERAMIIFDKEDLKIEVKATIEKQDGKKVFQVVLEDISFSYICINGSMCIIYKIWENKTQRVMYNMPEKWKVELWLAK